MYQRYNNNTMHQTQTTIIIFIILVSSLLNSHAWGPVTHLYLCSLADNETTTSTALYSFYAGCNSPDILKKEWPELHSLEFAAELFWHAYNSTTDGLIEFALGFGCHIASDEVGHHSKGFLNPPSADHEIEFNLDSMIYHERTGEQFDATREYDMSEHEINLILKAAAQYTSVQSSTHRNLRKDVITPKFIDRARMQSAINRFQLLTSAEHALLRIQPSSLYKFELQRHSFCNNVSNYQEVVTNFNLSADWAVSTCILWRRKMWTLIKRGDLKEAAPTIHRAVNELFQANNGTSCVI